MREKIKDIRGLAVIALCVLITFVGRFFYETRGMVLTETYTHFAHITIGMLFVLSYQGKHWATAAWIALTMFEVLMFLANNP